MAEFIQWKVVGPNEKLTRVKKTYDKLKSAKVDFGKACQFVDEDEKGSARLWGRTSFTGDWVLIQEFDYDCDDDDDDDEDEGQ